MQDAVVAVSTLDGTRKETVQQVDVAVVGAGFAGVGVCSEALAGAFSRCPQALMLCGPVGKRPIPRLAKERFGFGPNLSES